MNEEKPAAFTATAIEKLKRKAKAMSKAEGIPHRVALDRVAQAEGFTSWQAITKLS